MFEQQMCIDWNCSLLLSLLFFFFSSFLLLLNRWRVRSVPSCCLLGAVCTACAGVHFKANWGERKFRPETRPSLGNMAHNIFYTCLGTLQYAMWECIFLHCYATGKIDYVSNAELLSSPTAMVRQPAMLRVCTTFAFAFACACVRLCCCAWREAFVHSVVHSAAV